MFVLDTNHVSELTYRTEAGLRLLQKLDAANQDAAVTAITVEESLRGWLAEIRRRTEPRHQIAATSVSPHKSMYSHPGWCFPGMTTPQTVSIY